MMWILHAVLSSALLKLTVSQSKFYNITQQLTISRVFLLTPIYSDEENT